MTVIAELNKTGVTVDAKNLTIKSNDEFPGQNIELSNINKIYLDMETRYFLWLFYLILHVFIFISVLASNLATFLTWLLIVILAVSGLRLMMSPPANIFIIIDMKVGDPLKILLKDSKDRYFEFIQIANKKIHNPKNK